jgi:transposase
MSFNSAPVMAATVVAVDVGKNTAVLSVTDSARHRLLGPVEFASTSTSAPAKNFVDHCSDVTGRSDVA